MKTGSREALYASNSRLDCIRELENHFCVRTVMFVTAGMFGGSEHARSADGMLEAMISLRSGVVTEFRWQGHRNWRGKRTRRLYSACRRRVHI